MDFIQVLIRCLSFGILSLGYYYYNDLSFYQLWLLCGLVNIILLNKLFYYSIKRDNSLSNIFLLLLGSIAIIIGGLEALIPCILINTLAVHESYSTQME